jgi:protoheme IX farnesyltransferase
MSHAQPVSGRPETPPTPATAMGLRQSLLALFKVRIVLLLLFASAGGAVLAAGGWPGGGQMALLLIPGSLAASGASALNEYLERDVDARMQRTRTRRPLVIGSFQRPAWVPWLGLSMILLPSLAVFPMRPALTAFLLLGAFVYVPVYTLWLKQRTPLNIVVGGLAGSAAVLSGSAAVGAWQDPGAVLLALLVFFWTPTHFWSLAIVHRDDYARGGFPMLPVRVSAQAAARWVLLHTAGTALTALALVVHPDLGWIYLAPVSLASLYLVTRNLRLLGQPTAKQAYLLFHTTNLYLALVMLVICVDVLLVP